MGLSNISMTPERAIEIVKEVAAATRKWGIQARPNVTDYDLRAAITILAETSTLSTDVQKQEAYIEDLKAENLKLKQRISGFETAQKRKGVEK